MKENERRRRGRGDDAHSSSGSSDEEGEVDAGQIRALIANLFPSRYASKRAREAVESGTKSSRGRRGARRRRPSTSSESDGESSCDEEDEAVEALDGQSARVNIIFTMGGGEFATSDDEDDDSDYIDESDEEDEEYEEDEEDEECDEEYEEDYEEEYEEEDNSTSAAPSRARATASKRVAPSASGAEEAVLAKVRETLGGLTEAERRTAAGKHLEKELRAHEAAREKEMRKRTRRVRKKNTEKFHALLRDKSVMNDVRFFQDRLHPDEQQAVIRQIEEIKSHCEVDKPYRLALLEADIPVQYKAAAFKKLTRLRYMEPGSGEYYKIKQWVDGFMLLPFGKYKSLSLTIDDGVDACHEFMANAKSTLDNVVYGLDDAKLQVLQMVGQWIANPEAVGNAIAIQGPMGTGKTTLVKDGISKILGRDFAFFALGGATDSSVLEGHSYTYEGSMWGKIADILIQCGNMNPVIYFDELDKVSDTAKGEEIIGILTHLTDTSQNTKFHDKYFSEVELDLSRCLFIFSYNDESRVNPILRDRMYRIQTRGYTDNEKVVIARDYLLPKVRKQVRFDPDDIVVPDSTVLDIITRYTEGEEGVRNLKRCLEIVHTKLNLYRLMKPGVNLFTKDMPLDVSFPLTVTSDIVSQLVKKSDDDKKWLNMYN